MINNKYNSEEVFIIAFNETEYINNGYTNTNDKNIWSKFDLLGKYVLRCDIKGNKEIQQIIPYIIIKNQFNKYLVIKIKDNKLNKNSKIKMAIGFSDYIKKEDGYSKPLFKTTMRILNNDIGLKQYNNLKHIGYVRDLNSKTIQNALGIVFIVDCLKDEICIADNPFCEYIWMSKIELINEYGKLENWSKYIVDYMVDKIL